MQTTRIYQVRLMSTTPSRLQAAYVWFRKARPYLAPALWKLVPYSAPGLGTMAVDEHWRLYVDDVAISHWSVKETAGVLYHEVKHLLSGHFERGRGRDKARWAIAAECEAVTHQLNDHDKEALPLPGDPLTPEKFGLKPQLVAETYYRLLPEDANVKAPVCGSCAHGHQEPWELGVPTEDCPGVCEEEANVIKRSVAREMIHHAQQYGNLPAWAERFAERYGSRPTPWFYRLTAHLRRSMAHAAGFSDYSYSLPNRRQGVTDVILPAMVANWPEVAVIVDSSGSMSPRQLGIALHHVDSIIAQFGGMPVTVLSADVRVHTVARTVRANSVKLEGGGGTNMGKAIKEALDLVPRPEVVVVITDCYTPWPKTPPAADVIVLRVGGGTAPSWATVVDVEA